VTISAERTLMNWKKSVFIYPYEKPQRFNYYDLFPPVGMEYVATAVKDLVESVSLIDMRYETESIDAFLAGADIIGLSINWSHQEKPAGLLLDRIPGNALVIVGGIHAAMYAEKLFLTYKRIDIVVRGDGEETTRDIFSGKPLDSVDGISYRKAGKVVHNRSRILSQVLDIYPDRSLRRYAYRHTTPLGISFGLDTIMSSRGCPFRCEFCTHRLDPMGEPRPWAFRSAESVVEEIKSITADVIVISDDNFTVDRRRAERICDLLIERNIKKLFIVESRIDIGRSPQLIRKMWEAGFRIAAYGIESATNKTLERIGKGFTVEEALESAKPLRKVPMFYAGYFIIGYIGENEEEMLRIPGFAHQLGLDFISHSLLRALKNSPLRKAVENIPGYYLTEDGKIFSDEYPLHRLRAIRRKVIRGFYTPAQYLRILYKLVMSRMLIQPVLWKAVIVLLFAKFERNTKTRYITLR
jgi:anaerobic magnesium-protoporphyrin IX monomethyl ester cyclase